MNRWSASLWCWSIVHLDRQADQCALSCAVTTRNLRPVFSAGAIRVAPAIFGDTILSTDPRSAARFARVRHHRSGMTVSGARLSLRSSPTASRRDRSRAARSARARVSRREVPVDFVAYQPANRVDSTLQLPCAVTGPRGRAIYLMRSLRGIGRSYCNRSYGNCY